MPTCNAEKFKLGHYPKEGTAYVGTAALGCPPSAARKHLIALRQHLTWR
jgi:hypothetical protein